MLPDAQVTLIDEATGITHTLHTNRQGLYVFAALVPGTYSVKVEANGFKPSFAKGVVALSNGTGTRRCRARDQVSVDETLGSC